eukprot:8069847-Alexandrium_andersonii.AAC.1
MSSTRSGGSGPTKPGSASWRSRRNSSKSGNDAKRQRLASRRCRSDTGSSLAIFLRTSTSCACRAQVEEGPARAQ